MLLSDQARQIRWRERLGACHVGVRVGGHGVERVCVEIKGLFEGWIQSCSLWEKETEEISLLVNRADMRCLLRGTVLLMAQGNFSEGAITHTPSANWRA